MGNIAAEDNSFKKMMLKEGVVDYMIRRLDSKKDEAELVKCTFWALCNVIRTNAVILPC